MRRWLLLSIVCCLTAGSAVAEDYLLRLDEVGFIDHPAGEADPKDKTFRTIEVIARPGMPFHTKIEIGPETLLLAGRLEPSKDGRFRAEIRYRRTVDTGDTVPNEKNELVPVHHTTAFNTQIGIAPGERVEGGGLQKESQNGDGHRVTSRIRHVLSISKVEPPTN